MKYLTKKVHFSIILATVCTLSIACAQKKDEDKKKSDTSNLHWSYNKKTGPNEWANVSSKNAICVSGKSQSPINIETSNGKANQNMNKVDLKFRPTKMTLEKSGPLVRMVPTDASAKELNSVSLGSDTYTWKETQLHMPSEHTIDGKNADLEMEWMFENKEGKQSILSVLINEGPESLAAKNYIQTIKKNDLQKPQAVTEVVSVLGLFPFDNLSAFRYTGSLTTPPCTENVEWIVYKQAITMSKVQLNVLRKHIDETNRPLQKQNKRSIHSITTKVK